ncbi:SidA/IucD/PvdA family monooxygenase [Pedobacter petrophilus]|uniref:SidA/IucD/PvdA family monooxygenase n=1 Tax=Pedobacter petrophilus TaxID=1908241 RepID=A0A7K0G584_9SPHI|nr:SidA/IucD/PvdA family monooxygenase [Pedobacter petrophilus]MRX78389.1 SidA/IucD/PvdA family monooxygenase [Pedobacter petrophilus]
MNTTKIYDIIGIGIGPFNLGLAALSAPIADLNTLFLDQSDEFNWHPGLMLDEVTLQVPFMADLVTMADPASPYSFLNYMKLTGRLYKFYIRENFFIFRKEYNAYCKWVLGQLTNCLFSRQVVSVIYENAVYHVTARDIRSGDTNTWQTYKLVLGTGTSPYIPPAVKKKSLQDVIHTSQYLNHKDSLVQKQSVTIIGSGQSAAEIFQDLLPEVKKGMKLNWFTRSERFFPLENHTKLTLELTSPDYIDYFHNLPEMQRKDVLSRQGILFKGINADLINQIYNSLYAMDLSDEAHKVVLMANARLNDIQEEDESYLLSFLHIEQGKTFEINTDAVILATGYKYVEPDFLTGISNRIRRLDDGNYDVRRNYTIDEAGNEIFVQNAELHTHGISTPDLGMGAYRNSQIINQITGRTVYAVEQRIAFQSFSTSDLPVRLKSAVDLTL